MIERYQQAFVPVENLCGVLPEREFMIMNPLQGLKRDRSQRHNNFRIYQRNRALEKIRTVSNFTGGGSPVGARHRTRIAQGRTGDKDFSSFQVDRAEEPFEVLTRLIAGKGDPRTIGSFS